jgi:hypothetical protein
VLCYAQQNNVEPFLEPVLLLAHAMMARDAAAMAAGGSRGELLAAFNTQLGCFVDLCLHTDAPVAVAASQCLAQLVSGGVCVGAGAGCRCGAWRVTRHSLAAVLGVCRAGGGIPRRGGAAAAEQRGP